MTGRTRATTSTFSKAVWPSPVTRSSVEPEARKRLEKKLLRKLDARMGILIVIYILNYIDRNNAAAARLRGFEADLTSRARSSILYSVFFTLAIS
ncbi:hypothetical protein QCA50_000687 [Cerrena zonata]|uniref:MFS transporter n=1 Tax=Cerrena zonata TaxID=2478898 RepID=A0AAW0H0B2_9APHY